MKKDVLKSGISHGCLPDFFHRLISDRLCRLRQAIADQLAAVFRAIPSIRARLLHFTARVCIPTTCISLCALHAEETWTNLDIGSTGTAGGAAYDQNSGQFVIRGSGSDIWGQVDAFQFVTLPVVDSCEVIARVVDVQNTDPWAKAGVMIREDLSADSRHAMVVITPEKGASFQRRTTKGGASTSNTQAGRSAPYWVRLVRNGDLFLGFSSPDGMTWSPLGAERIPMSRNVFAGLAVTSHRRGKLCTATIDNVRVVSTPAPGNGTGLLGTYYNNSDFTSPQLSRIDPGLAFKWGAGGPDALVGNETFSARWTGELQARFSETYKLHTVTDDGVRLWLDGQLVIDNWHNHAATQNTVEIPLFAGERHQITIEYFENTGSATAQLLWESPSEPKQPVAASELFPANEPLRLQPPGNLRTIGVTPSTLSLAWDHPPGAAGAVVFDILRGGLTLASTSSSKFVLGGLAGGSAQSLVVRARDTSGQISSDTEPLNTATLPTAPLPQPWQSHDIGSVQKPGNAGALDGDWTVAGSGSDIWGTADRFHFAHQPLQGDGLIIARVRSQVPTDAWAKAGLMLRETSATGSRNALIAWTPANGVSFQWRQLAGKTSANIRKSVQLDRGTDGLAEQSVWLKLQRSGDDLHGFFSTDGLEWELIGSASIPLPSDLMAGLAVTSHNAQALSSARFDQFVLDYPPTVEITEPANGLSLPASTPVTLTADAQSPTSAISKVEFLDGDIWLGEATEFPFSIVWPDVVNGPHEIRAIATDVFGLTAESQPIQITIAETDSDADGLPDDWEMGVFGNLEQTAASDPDGDGIANRKELRFGSDPTDYFSQLGVTVSPKLSFIEGANQTGVAGAWLPQNLVILVSDALTGLPLRNARVDFSGSSGEVSPASAISDNLGRVSVRFRLPEQARKGALSASYGNASASCRFTVLSRDDDGDGIEDVWEISYLGDLESDSTADSDGDGLSNKEEFLAGSDPHDPKDATYDPDGDGIPTLWEIRLLTDPADASSKPPYDIIVDQSQPQDTAGVKKTIQAALDAVENLEPSKEFVTVYVREGRYADKAWIPSYPTPRKVALVAEKSGFGVELTSNAPPWDAVLGIEGDCVVEGFHFRKEGERRLGYVTAPFGKRIRVQFSNCIFSGGIDYYASCLFISSSDVLFAHCTIQKSGAQPAENTIYRFQNSVSLNFLNSILWNPTNPNEVSNPAAGAPAAIGSLIRGLNGASDPLLTPQGSLSSDSPARDSGSATLAFPVDIRGNPRDPVTPDIGAVEYTPDLDSDSDGLPDWLEALGISDPTGDADHDGLTNLAEYTAGSNPRKPDSDGDGLWDGLEIANNLNPLDGTDALDTDKDGVADLQEIAKGTNPQNSDTDADGIPDGWEFFLSLNPSDATDALLDNDGDGLTNIQEFQLGTNSRESDTDGDGLSDGSEIETGFDPHSNDLARDSDQDGLSDLLEMRLGTNIFSSDSDDDGFDDLVETLSSIFDPRVGLGAKEDTDYDGLTDFYELNFGLNPLLYDDTNADPDGDGLSIREEFIYGSSQFDADIDNDGLNDSQEREYGTNPWHRDSEGEVIPDIDLTPGDGLPDGWEIKYGFNPLQWDDPDADADGDGLGLFLEYRNGTNPLVADTDGDGTNDGTEVANNTGPNNPNWGGAVPAAPTQVTVVTNAEGQRVVSWQDNSNNEDGFKIREKQPDGTWKIVAELPADTTSVVLP